MVEIVEVIKFIRPQGGFIVRGNTFDGIEFLECEPFTEEEFNQAKINYQNWKEQKETEAKIKRQALLDKLGITEDEAKILLS